MADDNKENVVLHCPVCGEITSLFFMEKYGVCADCYDRLNYDYGDDSDNG